MKLLITLAAILFSLVTNAQISIKKFNNIDEVIQNSQLNEDNMTVSMSFENSGINILESNSPNINSTHIIFKSKLSGETITAVTTSLNSNIKSRADETITTITLPKGQLIYDHNSISVITSNKFAKISISETLSKENMNEYENFQKLFNEITFESDLNEFNMILTELSENKSWSCFSAHVGLNAARTALALAIAATALSAGVGTPTIIAALAGVAAGEIAVAQNCHQF